MSLVGSLEDLGLGDILQIVSLSRKSGLLLIHSEEGEGRIVFCDGLVRAGYVKGEPEDLRALLVPSNFLPTDEFERANELANARGVPVDDVIPESTSLSKERLDSLRREHVERTVFRIFSWKGGEFNFEVRDQIDARDREILMPTGINAQYLTMEATRLGDEGERSEGEPALPEEESSPLEDVGDTPMFSGEEEISDSQESFETPQDSFEPSSDAWELDEAPDAEAAADESIPEEAPPGPHELLALATARREVPELEDETPAPLESVETSAPAPSRPRGAKAACLIAIDPQLSTLEWQKATLADLVPRVHIFQSCESGVARIRQYLGRGETPVVLVSVDLPSDVGSGEDGVLGFVRRLKLLAPFMPVLVVHYEGAESAFPSEVADAVITGPDPAYLANSSAWENLGDAADHLRTQVSIWLEGPSQPAGRSQTQSHPPDSSSKAPPFETSEGLRRLRDLSAQVRDPAMHGEVMSLVLEFAAESFSRVAMFMVRDETAIGIAQRGLPSGGGPDDDEIRKLEFPVWEIEWFRRVLESGSPVRSEPMGDGDHDLALRLGEKAPVEAYVAPITSQGHVVALLYTDNLPGAEPAGDTTILEIALHEAGLALERALLERARRGGVSEA